MLAVLREVPLMCHYLAMVVKACELRMWSDYSDMGTVIDGKPSCHLCEGY